MKLLAMTTFQPRTIAKEQTNKNNLILLAVMNSTMLLRLVFSTPLFLFEILIILAILTSKKKMTHDSFLFIFLVLRIDDVLMFISHLGIFVFREIGLGVCFMILKYNSYCRSPICIISSLQSRFAPYNSNYECSRECPDVGEFIFCYDPAI